MNTTLYYPSALNHKAAITLVAHGLNVRPDAMHSLIRWLNNQGSEVYLSQLSGHYEGAIPIKEVTADVWQQEMLDGYQQAQKAANDHALPFYFLGYSLGALLGQTMILTDQEQPAFDKQVLIAPATAIRTRSYLVKLLFFLGKKFEIPSYTPRDYRFNERLPLNIYHILFSEEKKVKRASTNKANIPSLIIIDPKDELISYQKLVQAINQFKRANYQLLSLNSNLVGRSTRYHHLIIDKETMGAANWEKATTAMKEFLFDKEASV